MELSVKRATLSTFGFISLLVPGSADEIARPSECVRDKPEMRVLEIAKAPGTSANFIASDGQLRACIIAGRCRWETPSLNAANYSSFVERVASSRCSHSLLRDKNNNPTVKLDACQADEQLDRFVFAIQSWQRDLFSPQDACTDAKTFVDPGGLVVFQRSVPGACLNYGLDFGRLRSAALFTSDCGSSRAEQLTISSLIAKQQEDIGVPFSFGAMLGAHMVATGLTFDGGGWHISPDKILVDGVAPLGVKKWVQSISKIAEQQTNLDSPSIRDPLPSSSSASPIGRLAKWLSAGMAMFDAVDGNRSRAARNWMAASILIDPRNPEDTLLRRDE